MILRRWPQSSSSFPFPMAEAASERPVFSVGARPVTWGDVVAYAELVGAWDEIAEQAALGACAARHAEVASDAVDRAAEVFRHEHGLLAADDLEGWLERRGLTVDGWLAYVRRSLASRSRTRRSPSHTTRSGPRRCARDVSTSWQTARRPPRHRTRRSVRRAGSGVRGVRAERRFHGRRRPRDRVRAGRLDPRPLSGGHCSRIRPRRQRQRWPCGRTACALRRWPRSPASA